MLRSLPRLTQGAYGRNPVQEYVCPACGERYTSLQALTLIDMSDGLFHCEVCSMVLADAEDAGGGDGGGGGDSGRKERLAEAKALQVRQTTCACQSKITIFS